MEFGAAGRGAWLKTRGGPYEGGGAVALHTSERPARPLVRLKAPFIPRDTATSRLRFELHSCDSARSSTCGGIARSRRTESANDLGGCPGIRRSPAYTR